MILEVEAEMRILKPVKEVFESIVDPRQMSNYFITKGSARLEVDRTVIWTWDDFGAELPIHVKTVRENKKVSFLWSASGVETSVNITLEPVNDSITIIKIREQGWESDELGIKRFGQQTYGWVHMITCLKAYLEHGVNLRLGAF